MAGNSDVLRNIESLSNRVETMFLALENKLIALENRLDDKFRTVINEIEKVESIANDNKAEIASIKAEVSCCCSGLNDKLDLIINKQGEEDTPSGKVPHNPMS